MRLYLDLFTNDLHKAAGVPPIGGGAGGAKTPGAAVGGTGPEVVDCPLGAKCPDGGRHQMGSQKLQDHTQQAAAAGKTGQAPGDESTGAPTATPGVPPGATNMGSIGSEQAAPRVPPAVPGAGAKKGDKTLVDVPLQELNKVKSAHDLATQGKAATPPGSTADQVNSALAANDQQEADAQSARLRGQVKKTPGAQDATVAAPTAAPESAVQKLAPPLHVGEGDAGYSPVSPSEAHTEIVDPGSEEPKGHEDFNAEAFKKDPNNAKTRSMLQGATDEPEVGDFKKPEIATSGLQGEVAGAQKVRPGKETQTFPSPLTDENAAPHDSKPMDHYRLSQVARESGDEEGAKFQEGMARKRTEGMGSEDHKDLANQLHAAGMHDQAKYHEGIHARVNGASPAADKSQIGPNGERFDLEPGSAEHTAEIKQRPGETLGDYSDRLKREHGLVVRPNKNGYADSEGNNWNRNGPAQKQLEKDREKASSEFAAKKKAHLEGRDKHESEMRDTNHVARSKAENDLKSAKDTHAKLQAKAEELKAKNKEALGKHEEATKEYEKAKAEGKKVKRPKKPELEQEIDVPEKPELSEPETDHEKLQHETHTSRAQKVADLAESHLKNNTTLSDNERSRLQRAHQMATYHANIGYTPTAAHKKELGDVERAVSGMGIKENYSDMKAKEDMQATGAAAKAEDQDRQAQEKQSQKQAKVDEKAKAVEAKQQAKVAADQPKPPQTDLDHARVADHQSKAKKTRESLEAHMAQNPNMSLEDQQKAQHVIAELQKHEQLDMVPGKAQGGELKELQKLAGEHGKPPKPEGEGGAVGGSVPGGNVDTGGNYAMNMIHQGRGLAHGLANAATSPNGAAGQLGSQVINYGVSGAVHAGHHMLHTAHQQERERMPTPPNPASLDKKEAPVKGTPST